MPDPPSHSHPSNVERITRPYNHARHTPAIPSSRQPLPEPRPHTTTATVEAGPCARPFPNGRVVAMIAWILFSDSTAAAAQTCGGRGMPSPLQRPWWAGVEGLSGGGRRHKSGAARAQHGPTAGPPLHHQPAMTPTTPVRAGHARPAIASIRACHRSSNPPVNTSVWRTRAHPDAPLHAEPAQPWAARAQHGPTSGPPLHHQPRMTCDNRP